VSSDVIYIIPPWNASYVNKICNLQVRLFTSKIFGYKFKGVVRAEYRVNVQVTGTPSHFTN